MNSKSIFVADVGNTSIDIGRFELSQLDDRSNEGSVPEPSQTSKLAVSDFVESDWFKASKISGTHWTIGSVNNTVTERLQQLLSDRNAEVRVVDRRDFPLQTAIRNFNTVGIDRLAAATAVNQLRGPEQSAIIVDAGSAITIDCVSQSGVFLGGQIAPGLRLCTQSLAMNTDQLPTIELPRTTPSLIGDDTTTAIQGGVYWLVTAGIDGILGRLKRELAGSCDIFVTGGSMPSLLPHLGNHSPLHRPHLVLSGLATLHKPL